MYHTGRESTSSTVAQDAGSKSQWLPQPRDWEPLPQDGGFAWAPNPDAPVPDLGESEERGPGGDPHSRAWGIARCRNLDRDVSLFFPFWPCPPSGESPHFG